jgi:hypothetical protein
VSSPRVTPTRPGTRRTAISVPRRRAGRAARVVADRQALVGQAEDDLGRDDEARQAHGVDLRAATVAPRASGPWRSAIGCPSSGRGPRRGARRARARCRRDVRLRRARVVDDLPLRQVPGGEEGGGLGHRGGQRKVARGDDADDRARGRRRRSRRSPRRSARAADDDGHAARRSPPACSP